MKGKHDMQLFLLYSDHTRTSSCLSKPGGSNTGRHHQNDQEAGMAQGHRSLPTMPLFSSFKIEGRVTTSCLWHCCRAVTVGAILIAAGITMAIYGK